MAEIFPIFNFQVMLQREIQKKTKSEIQTSQKAQHNLFSFFSSLTNTQTSLINALVNHRLPGWGRNNLQVAWGEILYAPPHWLQVANNKRHGSSCKVNAFLSWKYSGFSFILYNSNCWIDFNSLGKLYFSLTFHLFLEKPDEIFQAGIFQPQP